MYDEGGTLIEKYFFERDSKYDDDDDAVVGSSRGGENPIASRN